MNGVFLFMPVPGVALFLGLSVGALSFTQVCRLSISHHPNSKSGRAGTEYPYIRLFLTQKSRVALLLSAFCLH